MASASSAPSATSSSMPSQLPSEAPSATSSSMPSDCLEPRPHLLEENFGPDYPRVMYKRNHNTEYEIQKLVASEEEKDWKMVCI